MQDKNESKREKKKNTIVSTIVCVNRKHAYVYELLNGEIISEKKVAA
ncbi:MAG TPA: hypothetical protein VK436_04200 [Methanocella sp.]|nr:hypothetical protein [Methanocella sp.]